MSEWIPVKDKEADFPCLASDKFGQMFIPEGIVRINEHTYEGKNFNFNIKEFLRGEETIVDGEKAYILPREIVAWMPLPKPYKEDK